MNFRIDYTDQKKSKKRKSKIHINGKSVCVTGTIPSMTRAQMRWWITRQKAATFHENVTKNTDYLIKGTTICVTTKEQTAKKYNIKIISFEDVA